MPHYTSTPLHSDIVFLVHYIYLTTISYFADSNCTHKTYNQLIKCDSYKQPKSK